MPKPLTVWITGNCGKFWKRSEYQTTFPASWEICMQVKKQQFKLDVEQQTGSKLGMAYIKDVYCHHAYLMYMQSTSCKMPDWMKHKLESRLPSFKTKERAQSQQQRRQWSNGWEILRVWSKVLEWHPNVCSSQQAGHGCKQSLKEGGNGRRGSYQLQGKWTSSWLISGFPGGSDGKESAYNAGDPGLILGLGRSPGEGNGNPL